MKTIMVTGLLCAGIGWIGAANFYEAKASKEQAAYAEALAEVNQRAEHYQSISEEYYADYQEAINREPTIITERVYVRTSPTDATADSGGGVGNGAAEGRVELHPETIRSATAVTDQAERDVQSCRAALHSLQSKIQAHNELQF